MLAVGLALAFSAAAPPNLVLIVADDLGYAELGCYGQKKIRTPRLDRMAAEGLRFTRFYAGNAVCAPSRCVLMTGKHPGHAAIRDNGDAAVPAGQPIEGQTPLPQSETTLAEILHARGYATMAAGKWGLGMFGSSGDPLRRGFDGFFGYNCQRHAHFHYPEYLYRNAERFELPGNTKKTGPTHSHDLMEAEALKFLGEPRDRPFFLFLPFTLPHVSVQIPEAELAEYRGTLGPDPAYDGKKGYLPHPAPHAAYAAMVTRVDRTVGKVLDALRSRGLAENTLVIFTSDNGPTHNVGGADSTFFESAGPLRGLKGSLYEGGIRVPCIAWRPGAVTPGSETAFPCGFVDLLPTLAAAAGAKAPPGLDGVDLTSVLAGRAPPAREALYWEFPGYGGQQAGVMGNLKAVRQRLGQGQATTELYDLAADEGERVDLAVQRPNDVRKLEAIMVREHVPSKLFPLPTIDFKPAARPAKAKAKAG